MHTHNNIDAYSDNELIACFQHGDDKAFEALIARHMPYWYKLIFNRTHNDEDVRDILQSAHELAITALRANKFRGGNFPSWFGKIAFNVFLMEHRKKQRRGFISLDDEGNCVTVPFADENPDTYVAKREFNWQVEHSLSKLTPLSRRLIELVLSEDTNYDRIIDHLKDDMRYNRLAKKKVVLTYGNVRAMGCRARQQFQQNFEQLQAS